MAEELEPIKNYYDVWQVLHRAILHLATAQGDVRVRVVVALKIISPLKNDHFPTDMRENFCAFEAILDAQIINESEHTRSTSKAWEQLPEQDLSGVLIVMKLSLPTCYDIAKRLAVLYEQLSRKLIQGGDDLNT